MAGLRRRYPAADDRKLFLCMARLNLGSDLFRKVYGDVIPENGSDSKRT